LLFLLTGGHQSFSAHKFLNNTTGLVLHSLVLVPFHPWRITHAMHHAHTGHMDRDEVFVPRTRSEKGIPAKGDASIKKVKKDGIELDELLEDVPAYRLFWLVMQQLVGWPLYLFTNVTSNSHYPAGTNHFLPSSALFKPHQAKDVIISDVALGVVIAGLTYACKQFNGWETFFKFYFVPYLFVNHWLVAITYLQHTDPRLPHYRGAEWNFQRGAYATVDRKFFGWVGPYVLHGITETHVAHHLVSKIPHYNAWKATDALKAYTGAHHLSSDENFLVSLWKSYRNCRYVDDEGSVVMMRDSYGRSSYKVVHDSVEDSGVDVTEK
jgi:omega-6 fatty acid desaturase (delta-12 desaturase)